MTLRDGVAGTALVVVTAVVAACGGASTTLATAGGAGVCAGQTGVSTASSVNYVVVLTATTQVGSVTASPGSPSPSAAPPVVLSGSLASVSGPGATHLELHICSRMTGAVVGGLHPAVTLRHSGAGEPSARLPLAVLQDAGEGNNGLAYGNNVALEGEHTYMVDVRIDTENSVTLTYQVPPVGPTPSVPPGCTDNHQLCGMQGT